MSDFSQSLDDGYHEPWIRISLGLSISMTMTQYSVYLILSYSRSIVMKYFTDLWPSFGYISVERIRPLTDSC